MSLKHCRSVVRDFGVECNRCRSVVKDFDFHNITFENTLGSFEKFDDALDPFTKGPAPPFVQLDPLLA